MKALKPPVSVLIKLARLVDLLNAERENPPGDWVLIRSITNDPEIKEWLAYLKRGGLDRNLPS